MVMYLFFDTETTGLPFFPSSDYCNRPRIVQIAWILIDEKKDITSKNCYIIKPEDFIIPKRAVKIHGISMKKAIENGVPVDHALHRFIMDVNFADILVAHNIKYDYGVVRGELLRKKYLIF